MALNNTTQPLPSGLVYPAHQTNKGDAPNRRRFSSLRSAPLAEFVNSKFSADGAPKKSHSIFGKFHPNTMTISGCLAAYLGIGTMCFYSILDDIKGKKTNAIVDSLYFCTVTMTTVGYGDLAPNSAAAKLLASVFAFVGMALVGLIMNKAADYLIEKQKMLLVEALHMHNKHGPSETLKEIEASKKSYKYMVVMAVLSVLMVIGTTFLVAIEGLDIIDAFYCACSTMTTLGYGDESFASTKGRVFAVFWILTSCMGLGQFFLSVVDRFTETRQRELANWVLSRRMINADLEAPNIDKDGIVGVAEFVLYKLKETGKISQEDIWLLLEEFEKHDIDESKTLPGSDLMSTQTPETKK